MMEEKELKEFLNDEDVVKVIRDSLGRMMEAVATVHAIIPRKEMSHVDPEIIADWRNQSYSLFERASACNALLRVAQDEKVTNEYIRQMFAQTYLNTTKMEDSFRLLTKTMLSTYAPQIWKEYSE